MNSSMRLGCLISFFLSLTMAAACGSDEKQGEAGSGGQGGTGANLANAGGNPGDAAALAAQAKEANLPGDLVPSDQVPELKSGTRLHLSYLVLDDGMRVVEGVKDTSQQLACVFTQSAKEAWRCQWQDGGAGGVVLNSQSSGNQGYSDPGCTAAVLQAGSASSTQPYPLFAWTAENQTNQTPSSGQVPGFCTLDAEPAGWPNFRSVAPLAAAGLTLFRKLGANGACQADNYSVSANQRYVQVGGPAPLTTFVKGTRVQEDGKVWPVLQGEDGSQLWLTSADPCVVVTSINGAPAVPATAPRLKYVGTGRIKAAPKAQPYNTSTSTYSLYDSTRKEACDLEPIAETPSQFRCLPGRESVCSALTQQSGAAGTTYIYKDEGCTQLAVQISALAGLKDTTDVCRIAPTSTSENAFYHIGKRTVFNGEAVYRKNSTGACESIPGGVRSTYVEIGEQAPWTDFATVSRVQE